MSLFKRKESTYQISSMKRTRIPVFHRFWGASMLVALIIGFPFGSWIWAVLRGLADTATFYEELRWAHLNIQIFVFFGLYVAGFALQSGAHVLGGSPPKSEQVIWIFPLILLGVLLKVLPVANVHMAGNVIITAGNLWLLYVMVVTALGGNKERLVPIGSLFFIGFSVFAAAPWLDLNDPAQAFFVLWSGVFLIVLAAGQQLIANVLGAKRFNQFQGVLFALAALASVVTMGLTVFAGINLVQVTGIFMVLAIVLYISFLGVVPALIETGFTSLVMAFVFNFLWALIIAFSLIFVDPNWDFILHILALGSITTMIIAVGARVLGFFSGKAAFSDGGLTLMVMVWQLVPLIRGGGQYFEFGGFSAALLILTVEVLFSLWAILCFKRVLKVMNPDKVEEK